MLKETINKHILIRQNNLAVMHELGRLLQYIFLPGLLKIKNMISKMEKPNFIPSD